MIAREAEQIRRTKARLRIIQHYQQVTRDVSLTCRFFGISRSKFYFWMTRYRKLGGRTCANIAAVPASAPMASRPSLRPWSCACRRNGSTASNASRCFWPAIIRCTYRPRRCTGSSRSPHVPRVSLKRYRPGPRRRRDIRVPGQSVQVDYQKPFISGSSRPRCSTNRLTITTVSKPFHAGSVASPVSTPWGRWSATNSSRLESTVRVAARRRARERPTFGSR